MPAAKAGIQLGDDLVSVNGTPIHSVFSMIHFLQQNGDKPVDVVAIRNGQHLNFNVTPVQTDDGGQKAYRLGFRAEPVQVDKLPFGKALERSLRGEQEIFAADGRSDPQDGGAQSFDQAVGWARSGSRAPPATPRVSRAGLRCLA